MATPFLYVLRRTYSELDIRVLCRSYTAPLFRLCPAIDAIAVYERSGGIRGALAALAREVPKEGRTMCFVLPRSFASALVSFISRAPRRVGYAGDCRSLLLTDALPSSHYRRGHLTDAYLRLLEAVTGHDAGQAPLPVVVPAYEWQGALEAIDLRPGYIVLAPGAEYGGAKLWPAGRYAELAIALAERVDGGIVIVGSERERGIADDIISESGIAARSLAGQCTVDMLLSVLRGASLVVGNDSGPVHISAAMGRPTIALFGSTSSEWTSPRGRSVGVVETDIECSPCFKRECPHGEPRCMLDIEVSRVFELALRMLAAERPAGAGRDL